MLASWRDSHGNTWVKIRVPKRPNGVTGWVPRRALRQYTAGQHLPGPQPLEPAPHALPRRARQVMSAHVGIGSGANPTPRGRFYVREKFHVKGRAGLRALRAGHERIRAAPDRLARGRRRRPARHQRAWADPRPPVARLHPPAQREDHAPVPADPARHAAAYPRLRPRSCRVALAALRSALGRTASYEGRECRGGAEATGGRSCVGGRSREPHAGFRALDAAREQLPGRAATPAGRRLTPTLGEAVSAARCRQRKAADRELQPGGWRTT